MNTFIIIVIIISSLTNMLADILLVSGKDFKIKNQSRISIIQKTPDKHLFLSAYIGATSIALWLSVIYYLAKIPSNIGYFAMLSLAIYIGFIMTYHVVLSFIFYIVKYDESKLDKFKKILVFFMIMTSLFSLIYTLLMIYLSSTGEINMSWLQILTLPFFSMLIIQFGLGNILKKIPHFESIAGTLGMMIALLSTISIFV